MHSHSQDLTSLPLSPSLFLPPVSLSPIPFSLKVCTHCYFFLFTSEFICKDLLFKLWSTIPCLWLRSSPGNASLQNSYTGFCLWYKIANSSRNYEFFNNFYCYKLMNMTVFMLLPHTALIIFLCSQKTYKRTWFCACSILSNVLALDGFWNHC